MSGTVPPAKDYSHGLSLHSLCFCCTCSLDLPQLWSFLWMTDTCCDDNGVWMLSSQQAWCPAYDVAAFRTVPACSLPVPQSFLWLLVVLLSSFLFVLVVRVILFFSAVFRFVIIDDFLLSPKLYMYNAVSCTCKFVCVIWTGGGGGGRNGEKKKWCAYPWLITRP